MLYILLDLKFNSIAKLFSYNRIRYYAKNLILDLFKYLPIEYCGWINDDLKEIYYINKEKLDMYQTWPTLQTQPGIMKYIIQLGVLCYVSAPIIYHSSFVALSAITNKIIIISLWLLVCLGCFIFAFSELLKIFKDIHNNYNNYCSKCDRKTICINIEKNLKIFC